MIAGNIPVSGKLALGALMAGFAICGWLCVYKTEVLVAQQRRRYEEHWWVRAYPFSSMVVKDWYPTYLRCGGIFLWIFDLFGIYLIWFAKPAH
jgi:hypothetical protein